LTLEDALVMAKLLKDAGVDVFDVTLIARGGWKETSLPVIAVGKFGIGDAALRAVQDENIDLIAVGRQMICD